MAITYSDFTEYFNYKFSISDNDSSSSLANITDYYDHSIGYDLTINGINNNPMVYLAGTLTTVLKLYDSNGTLITSYSNSVSDIYISTSESKNLFITDSININCINGHSIKYVLDINYTPLYYDYDTNPTKFDYYATGDPIYFNSNTCSYNSEGTLSLATHNTSVEDTSSYVPVIIDTSIDETNLITIHFYPGAYYDDSYNFNVTYGPSDDRLTVDFSDYTKWIIFDATNMSYLFKFRPSNPWDETQLTFDISMSRPDPVSSSSTSESVTLDVVPSDLILDQFYNKGDNTAVLVFKDYANEISYMKKIEEDGEDKIYLNFFDANISDEAYFDSGGNYLLDEAGYDGTTTLELKMPICTGPKIGIQYILYNHDGKVNTDYYCMTPTEYIITSTDVPKHYVSISLDTNISTAIDSKKYEFDSYDCIVEILNSNFEVIVSREILNGLDYSSKVHTDGIYRKTPIIGIYWDDFESSNYTNIARSEARYIRIKNLVIRTTYNDIEYISNPVDKTLDYLFIPIYIKNVKVTNEENNIIQFTIQNSDYSADTYISNGYYKIYDNNNNILMEETISTDMKGIEYFSITKDLKDTFNTDSITLVVGWDFITPYYSSNGINRNFALPYTKKGIIMIIKIPKDNVIDGVYSSIEELPEANIGDYVLMDDNTYKKYNGTSWVDTEEGFTINTEDKYMYGLLCANMGTYWAEALEIHTKESDDATTYTQLI